MVAKSSMPDGNTLCCVIECIGLVFRVSAKVLVTISILVEV